MRRKMYNRFLMVAMIATMLCLGSLTACSTISSALQSPTQTIEVTCTAVGAAVQTLAVAKQDGRVNATTEKTVDGLIRVTEPICTAPVPPPLSDAEKTLFINAATQLANLASTYGSAKLPGVSNP